MKVSRNSTFPQTSPPSNCPIPELEILPGNDKDMSHLRWAGHWTEFGRGMQQRRSGTCPLSLATTMGQQSSFLVPSWLMWAVSVSDEHPDAIWQQRTILNGNVTLNLRLRWASRVDVPILKLKIILKLQFVTVNIWQKILQNKLVRRTNHSTVHVLTVNCNFSNTVCQ